MNQSYEQHQTEGIKIMGGLTDLVTFALTEHFPGVRVDLNDVEQVLDALHALGPHVKELGLLDGSLQQARGDWQGAVQTLRGLVDAGTALPYSRAKLLYALHQCGDPQWRVEAEALRESDDPQVSLLAHGLMARADLQRERAALARTGRFEMPESVAAMREARERAANARAGAEPARVAPESKAKAATPLWASRALRA